METGFGGKQQKHCPKYASGRVWSLPSPSLTRCHEALARLGRRAGGHIAIVGEGPTLSCQQDLSISFSPRWPAFLPSFYSHLPSLRKGWGFNTIFRRELICKTGKLFISRGCFILPVGSRALHQHCRCLQPLLNIAKTTASLSCDPYIGPTPY